MPCTYTSPSLVTLYVLFACLALPDFFNWMTRCGFLRILLVSQGVGDVRDRVAQMFQLDVEPPGRPLVLASVDLHPVRGHQRLVLVVLRRRGSEQFGEMLVRLHLVRDL